MALLTDEQHRYLIRPIKPSRVESTQGQSYLPAYDVIAHLTRIFGWEGWDKQIVSTWQIHETPSDKNGKEVWTVAHGCSMRLTIRNPAGETVKVVEDVGTGEAINQPSRGDAHDLALKTAVSGALKRCAKDLGDGFGLGLYDKGSLDPTMRKVIAYDPPVVLSTPEDLAPTGGREDVQRVPGVAVGQPTVPGPPPDGSLADRAAKLGPKMTEEQRRRLFVLLGEKGIADRHEFATEVLSRNVESFSDLLKADADELIKSLVKMPKSFVEEPPF